MAMNDAAYLAQLGSLNSGRRVADADFDELRIWDNPRYAGNFVPERKTATPLPEGLLYLGFEGDYVGRFRAPDGEATVQGIAGTAGR